MCCTALEQTKIRIVIIQLRLVEIRFDQCDELTHDTDAIVIRWNRRMTSGHAYDNIDIEIALQTKSLACTKIAIKLTHLFSNTR